MRKFSLFPWTCHKCVFVDVVFSWWKLLLTIAFICLQGKQGANIWFLVFFILILKKHKELKKYRLKKRKPNVRTGIKMIQCSSLFFLSCCHVLCSFLAVVVILPWFSNKQWMVFGGICYMVTVVNFMVNLPPLLCR